MGRTEWVAITTITLFYIFFVAIVACEDSPTKPTDTIPQPTGFYQGADSTNDHLQIGFLHSTDKETPTGLNDSLIIRNVARGIEWAGVWWKIDHQYIGLNEYSCGDVAGIYFYESTYLLRLTAADDPCVRSEYFTGYWIPVEALPKGILKRSQPDYRK